MLCKTITADNGREFADISTLKQRIYLFSLLTRTRLERGSNERHNGLLRLYPKEPHKRLCQKKRFSGRYIGAIILAVELKRLKVFIEEVNKVMDLQSVQFHIAI